MKYAIFTVTKNGAAIAQRVQKVLGSKCDVYIKEGRGRVLKGTYAYNSLAEYVGETFYRYDALVFIMATGIVVRMIAPYIVHKTQDPAVVVLDEQAKHVISLLSGHLGGANALALQLAEILGADPVITTATDVNGKTAVDVLAQELTMRIIPVEHIKNINAGIVQGDAIAFYIDKDMRQAKLYLQQLQVKKICARIVSAEEVQASDMLRVFITEKNIIFIDDKLLVLQPRRLVIGIGCRRNTTQEEIEQAFMLACKNIGRNPADITVVASSIVKKDEAGLLALAEKLNIPILFFTNEELQNKIDTYHLTTSEFVQSKIGVGNVCEAAALCACQSGKLILHKTKLTKVTVAIAWEK
jgi:cobalt-precorrin 5A hydrolase